MEGVFLWVRGVLLRYVVNELSASLGLYIYCVDVLGVLQLGQVNYIPGVAVETNLLFINIKPDGYCNDVACSALFGRNFRLFPEKFISIKIYRDDSVSGPVVEQNIFSTFVGLYDIINICNKFFILQMERKRK